MMFGAVLCIKAVEDIRRSRQFSIRGGLLAGGLVLYAVLTFVYFYRTTGGASSVEVLDGHYVSMYKDHVIRTITAEEYAMFPNLWVRVMTAWIVVAATIGVQHHVSD
jgi:hypothetical protein